MSSGSEDYYTPDEQLADSLDAFDNILAKLHTTVKNVDDIMNSIGTNLNSLTNTMKNLLTTLRSQAMGDSTSLHASGSGALNAGISIQILPVWTGRTGFCVTNTGPTGGIFIIGGSTKYGMAAIAKGESYQNETYCGAIRIKSDTDFLDYAYEEW